MALRFPSEQLAYLCESARLLVQRAAHHKNDLRALMAAAENEVRHAETALTYALGEADVPASRVRSLLSSHLQQSVHGVDAARQLWIGAGEQHVVASRLLTLLEADPCVEAHPDERPRRDAVLVVDDYGAVRESIASVLQSAGFVVRTASNGLEALLTAYEMRPSVIVMDVTMPVLDGIEATRLIKAIDATRHARVIAYTGDGALDDTPLRTLFAAVVKKPALPSVVLATVRSVAGS